MALPSQTIRPVTTRATSYRKARRRRVPRAVWLVLGVGALVAAVVYFWPESEEGAVGGTTNAPLRAPGTALTRGGGLEEAVGGASAAAEERPGGTEVAGGQPVATEAAGAEPGAPVAPGPGVAATDTPITPPAAEPPVSTRPDVRALLTAGLAEAERGNLVEARALLNRVILDEGAPEADRARARARAAEINEQLVFSPKVYPGDPFTLSHTVASGETLGSIASSMGLAVHYNLLARVNRLPSADMVRLGQRIKLVRGPFHAVVHKGDFRMDVFAGDPDDPGSWVYIRSFRVGLGEGDSTPVGTFRIRRNSKTVNPGWVNPLTNERFAPDDPKNPIGEYWLGLEGVGESEGLVGFGLHGTIDPESIGQMKSMGCVRLGNEDIALVFELLAEGVSLVRIER